METTGLRRQRMCSLGIIGENCGVQKATEGVRALGNPDNLP